MKKLCALILLGGLLLPCASRAIDFKQAKFTQVVNSVEVISSDKIRHAASVDDVFKMPEVLHTGPASRAELVANDNTITRVGANTIFSFDPASRTLDLQQGSLLFHSPHGKGGGTIHTGSATASVLGTTIIVTTTPNGGFKVMVLEGEAQIRFLNGLHTTLTPGQMTFVLPGGGTSPIVVFRLDDATKGSKLINGFNSPLPSWLNINTEITRQLLLLLNNKLQDTGLIVPIDANATPQTVQVRMAIIPQGQPTVFDNDSSIIGENHTPNQPLPVNYPPFDPAQLQSSPFPYPGVPSFTEGLFFLGIINPSAGFVGNNIDIDTGVDTPIDLSAFAGNSDFDIMAKGDMRIWQSVMFTGTTTESASGSGMPDAVGLFAGGQMLIAPGSTLEADTKLFGLAAGSFGVLDTDDGTVDIPNMLLDVSFFNYVGDVDILSLSDLTIEGMNSYWTVYAGGGVNIQSDGTLTLGNISTESRLERGYDVAIDAGGDVTLTAGLTTGGDLNLGNVGIYAGDSGLAGQPSFSGGSINMNAGGDVFITGSYLSAYSGETGYGDVTIFGVRNVDIEDTYIGAAGDVNIESGNSLTLGNNSSWDIYAGGSIFLTADAGDVYVDYDLYAGGDVDIFSGGTISPSVINAQSGGGNIDLEDSSIYAGDNGAGGETSTTGGAVNIRAVNGDVYLSDDNIYAYGGESTASSRVNNDTAGNVNVNAGGNVDILNTDINQDRSVYVDAGNHVSLFDVFNDRYDDNSSDTYLTYWNITAGSFVEIDADANVQIYNSSIYANDGDVDITSEGSVSPAGASTETSSSDITIGSSYIQAWNSVNVTANDGSVCIKDGSTLIAENGDVNIEAMNGGINLKGNSTLAANGSVFLNADDNIYINDSPISATSGSSPNEEASSGDQVSISSGGKLTVNGTFGGNSFGYDIGADFEVNLWGSDGVSLDNVLIKTLDGFSDDIIRITGDGNICISDGSELDSAGSVTIEAYGGNVKILDSKIMANGGDAFVSADNGTLTVNAGHVFAAPGSLVDDVDIYASGIVTLDGSSVTIKDTTIFAGDEVDISSWNGNVKIEDAQVETDSGNVNVAAYNGDLMMDSGSANYGVSINASGSVFLSADDNANILNSRVLANGGDVTIAAGQHLSIAGGVNFNSISGNNVTLTAGTGGVSVSDENITAVNGDLTINAGISHEEEVAAGSHTSSAGDSNSHFAPAEIGGVSLIVTSSGDVETIFVNANPANIPTDIDEESQTITAPASIDLNAVNTVTVNNSTLTAQGGHVGILGGGAVSIFGSGIYADAGNVGITSSGSTVDIEGGSVTASGNVNVESSDTLTVGFTSGTTIGASGAVSLKSDTGDADVRNSYIYSHGANGISIGADGNVNLSGDTVEAYDSGGVSINAIGADNTMDIEDTYFFAYGDVHVESDDTLKIGQTSGDTIIANGAVNLISDNGDVDVNNYNITSYGANGTTISAKGNVNLGGNYIYAYNSGGVTIKALGASSAVDIEGTYVYAGGDVNVESSSTLTVGTSSGNSIFANGAVYLTSDTGDANVNNYYVYASGENGVNVSAFGTIDMENEWAEAYNGSVTLKANQDVNLINDNIYADAGNVEVRSTGGSVDIKGSYLYASGSVNVRSSSDLTLGSSVTPTLISSTGDTIDATGSVNLTSDNGDVNVFNGTVITARQGDVAVSANNGSVDVEGATVNAGSGNNVDLADAKFSAAGNVNINAFSGSLSISAGDTVTIRDSDINLGGDISIDASELTAGAGDSGAGNLNIFTGNALSISGDSVSLNNVDIEGNNVSISDGASLTANNGDVNIDNFGSAVISWDSGVDVSASTINVDNISISDSVITANNGNINIVDHGDVILPEASESDVTANQISITDSTVAANSGNVTISTKGDIDIGSSVISATVGIVPLGGSTVSGDSISISADGTVTVNGEYGNYKDFHYDIGADSLVSIFGRNEVDINNAWVQTLGGSLANKVDISSGGDVMVDDSFIGSSGGVSVKSGGILTVNAGRGFANTISPTLLNDFDIDAGGNATLDAGTSASVLDTAIYAGNEADITGENGNVLVEDALIETGAGNVNITADKGNLTLDSGNHEYGVTINAGATVNLTADGVASISDADVTANSGNVNLTAGDGADLKNSTVSASGSAETTGNVTVKAGTGITVNGTSISGDTVAGTITLDSTAGQTTIENGASAQSFYLNVNSPDGILIDGTSGGGVHLSGNTMNLKGSYTDSSKGITVNNANLTSYASVNMSAHTISLTSVAFGAGSYDNFHTFFGALAANPNTGSSAQAGYLNFITGVTYGGTLITSGNQLSYVNPSSGPGIFVSTLPP